MQDKANVIAITGLFVSFLALTRCTVSNAEAQPTSIVIPGPTAGRNRESVCFSEP
ncbi:MAG TPA: hypothetical protein VJN66_07835 [Rhodanobacteraceae bacterium]|nr:hypothetical protein [Rhodanobacteraceae bacterium]